MIGNPNEPGVTSSVRSAPSVTTSGPSAGTPLLVAAGDLENGEASANTVESCSSSADAQRLFGDASNLTAGIMQALNQGAQPVLGVAPEETTVTQDLSAIDGTSATTDEPLKEDAEEITVTVDGTDKTVVWTLKDPSNETPGTDEVLINPTSDTLELDDAPSTDASIEYTAVDYQAALNALPAYTGDVDILSPWKERSDVTTQALGAANEMETERTFVLVQAGIPHPVDADAFTNSYDTSRLVLYAATRTQDFGTSIPALLGTRARLGLTSTPINQQVPLQSRPEQGLNTTERGTLIDKNVVPLERIGESVRVTDDVTTVSDENSEEQNYKYGFSRMALDFLIEVVHDLEKPFVGKFNSPGAIGQLQDLLNNGARPLGESNVIYDYNAEITMISPTKARVTFQADVAEPIRFIENDFVIGQNLQIQN